MKFFVTIVQNVFFYGVKVQPKQKWIKEVENLGKVEKIKIERKNSKISCLKIINPNPNNKVVIFGHPIAKRGKFFFGEGKRIRAYMELGYDIVLFDFNGFGETDRIDLFYWQDAAAVIKYFSNSKHLIFHGVSFGAYHGIPALKTLPQNSSVVLENVNRSLFDYWKKWFLPRNAIRLMKFIKFRAFQECEAVEVIKHVNDRSDIRCLFIGCEKDPLTPCEEMESLISHLEIDKKFIIFKEADHYQAPEVNEELYFKSIKEIAL